MRSLERGTSTSGIDIVNVSAHGLWLSVRGKEFFLPYDEFPWFQDARLSEIRDVTLVHGRFLRWEALDVDIALDSLAYPDRYPLKAQ